MIRNLIVLMMLMLAGAACAQSKTPRTKLRTGKNGVFVEKYRVLVADTACRHGDYNMLYKNQVIEKGKYYKGEKVGEWSYWGLDNQLEFVYNYDNRTISKVTIHEGQVYTKRDLPCLFLGSPLIPRLFICHKVFYPVKEHGTAVDCTVVLSIKVNANGRMTGYELAQESKPAFNKAVLDAAAMIPKSWRWVPARKGGRFVDSDYRISIVFDASN